ncbi:L-2-hydroxyglutarate oxidase [Kitasatospora kifunensis]|uniref:L-2-hydroxyglutarate oxidase n=1 Tax=Kitasatospora kifunensis TaxID=58351 RepID=A0A7W7R2J8_KITKI|nr:L-2-hydroxyglutarate oxidase [Kitasatospora kifunensis]MBB4924234.1 L-2-hydroxyglutarate oxidase [Kitasatospora kifunensis]
MMAYDYDVLVVGAGIVGLATALALTQERAGLRVGVLEKEAAPAGHQTGHNSGVIHSGVYYRPGSLKARYATEGAAAMVAFCREHGLAHQVPGKLIVATSGAELPRLAELAARGRRNGITVEELTARQILDYEPAVAGLAGLRIDSTGICDFGEVARTYARLAAERGAVLRTRSEVRAIERRTDGITVRCADGAELRCAVLVNCAGLYSDRLAQLAGDDPGLRIIPFRGEYYELTEQRSALVRGLVYPVPDPAFPFLGVHLTRGIDGEVHVGPNAVPALAREGYHWHTVRPGELAETLRFPGSRRLARQHWRYGLGELHRSLSKHAFTAAVQRLLPSVTAADLVRAGSGVRAQAVARDGTLLDDFAFAGFDPGDPTSTRRLVHVLNAPSPAATASLPIGREVARRALAALDAGG